MTDFHQQVIATEIRTRMRFQVEAIAAAEPALVAATAVHQPAATQLFGAQLRQAFGLAAVMLVLTEQVGAIRHRLIGNDFLGGQVVARLAVIKILHGDGFGHQLLMTGKGIDDFLLIPINRGCRGIRVGIGARSVGDGGIAGHRHEAFAMIGYDHHAAFVLIPMVPAYAFMFEQPTDEGEIVFLVLHDVFALGIAALQIEFERRPTEVMAAEHLPHDIGHGQLLENAGFTG